MDWTDNLPYFLYGLPALLFHVFANFSSLRGYEKSSLASVVPRTSRLRPPRVSLAWATAHQPAARLALPEGASADSGSSTITARRARAGLSLIKMAKISSGGR